MFRYNTYVRMRWVSIALLVVLAAAIIRYYAMDSYGMELHQWAKLQHAKAQIWLAERFWGHLALGGVLLLALFFGFSTILTLLPAMFFWPPWVGAVVVLMIHLALVELKYRQYRANPDRKLLPETLSERLPALDTTLIESVCLKLFLNLPGQAVDLLLFEKKAETISFKQTRLGLFLGTGLRVMVGSIWAGSLTSVIVNFHPFPERLLSLLLLGTAVIMWGLVWSFVPELMPGEKNLQKTCQILFDSTPPKQVQADESAPAEPSQPQKPQQKPT